MKNQDVYIIDDSADHRFLLQQIFNRFISEYNVQFFAGGEELFHHFRMMEESELKQLPGLIVLDLNMPVMTGYQVLTRLKDSNGSGEDLSGIPVVIMTSYASPEDVARCYKAGVNSFLLKPTGFEDLKSLLKSISQYWLGYNRLPFGQQ